MHGPVRRRLFGLAPAAVRDAFSRLEQVRSGQRQQIAARLTKARAVTEQLRLSLAGAEGALREAEARAQAELPATLQVRGQGQELLAARACEYTQLQQAMLESLHAAEEQLSALQRTRAELGAGLRRLAAARRAALGSAPVPLPLRERALPAAEPGPAARQQA